MRLIIEVHRSARGRDEHYQKIPITKPRVPPPLKVASEGERRAASGLTCMQSPLRILVYAHIISCDVCMRIHSDECVFVCMHF